MDQTSILESLLPELSNTSTSGSSYHDLKATDDMFKGGIEQENTLDDMIYHNMQTNNQEEANKMWKTVKVTFEKIFKYKS